MNLVERVKGIILSPRTEWPVIEREPGGVAHLFANYVAILAGIAAVAALIGNLIKGVPLGTALLWAVALDWVIWSTLPDRRTLLGGSIVIASGLYLIFREHSRGRGAAARAHGSPAR